MRRNLLILLSVCVILCSEVLAGDVSVQEAAEKQPEAAQHRESHDKPQFEPVHPQKQNSAVKHSVKGHTEVPSSDKQYSEVHHSDKDKLEVQHEDKDNIQVQHDDKDNIQVQHHDKDNIQVQHSDESKPAVHQNDNKQQEVHHTEEHQSELPQSTKQQVPTGRQFHPPPYQHPMLFQPPTGFEAIRRQLGGGFGSDLVMMGLITLPILGLLTMGSASIGNLLGLGSSSSSSKKSSKRNRRSLKEKAADAVEYAKNLWNVMEQLEKAFEKYDLYQAECRLRVVCEAHHKDRRMGSWGQSILDLMRQQKELEGRELLPVSRFLFSNYAEAAQAGARNENCAQLYTGCPRHLSYYLSAKEDQLENEVENGM